MITDIKFIPYDDTEEIERRARSYIERILVCAKHFESRMHIRPTVFMSVDVLGDIARGSRVAITRYDRGEAHTVCGYELKTVHGEKVLYLGWELL